MNAPLTQVMVPQSDPMWQAARRGHGSTSRIADMVATLKSGAPAQAQLDYAIELVAERACEYLCERYVTAAMQRGLDMEPVARTEFEIQTGHLVAPAAWVLHPTIEWFGSTPDGFIDADALLEVKVPSVQKFVRWVLDGKVPDEHLPQLIGQQSVTGRRITHFVAFCPEMPEGRRLFVREFTASDEQIEKTEAAVRAFLDRVDTMFIEFTHK